MLQELKTAMIISHSIKCWLLESSDPSMCYRTYVELLGMAASEPEAVEARRAIPTSAAVQQILGRMHPEGYWEQRNPRTRAIIGDGVEYGSFATTHFCLSYLAHLGMNRQVGQVALAANRYLDLMQPDGDWYMHFSCLYGYNIQTFIMLGYRDDKRLQRSIKLLVDSARADGGYLCDMHETKTGKCKVKSCIRGSLKALTAFCALGPEYWDHPSCKRLVGYFLDREGIYSKKDLQRPVNKDVQKMIFPFHWRSGLVEVLYTLSRMGYGMDSRLERAWRLLNTKVDRTGRYILEWTPTQSSWKVGKRGHPNKWMTLYALLAMQAREESRGEYLEQYQPAVAGQLPTGRV